MAELRNGNGISWANKPGVPKEPLHDNLPFVGGKKICDVDGAELANELIKRGVGGVSHENGRIKNLEIYAAYIEQIGRAGYDKAVAEWLRAW